MDTSPQCRNMVEQQIRTWEVLEDRVLDLYYRISRADFVPEGQRPLAYTDMQLPLGYGQAMLEPKTEARILQELAPEPTDSVLHIGTGSGYFAALLAQLCGHLKTVEIVPALADAARGRLAALGQTNVEVETGDGLAGPPDHQYNAVVLTGSVPAIPPSLIEQLAPGGRLLAPVGTEPVCTMQRLHLVAGRPLVAGLFETWIPPLAGGAKGSAFVF